MSRIPLRLRLTLTFAIVMAALLGATGAYLYVRLQSTLDEQLEQNLLARADDVAALVRTDSTLGESDRVAESEDSFAQVIELDPLSVDATPPLERRSLLTPAQLAEARRRMLIVDRGPVPGLDDPRVRLLARPVDDAVVVAGASLEDRDEALADLRTQLLIGGPIALLLASLAGYLLAGAALRPVESMRQRAQEISATVGGGRLPVPESEDEITRLARTLNEMLARIERGVQRERRFVAEASHELRTPLALLQTELELALRRPRTAEELRAAITSAAEETDRLVALAEDLLVLARSDEGRLQLEAEPLSARELLETVAGRFAGRARDAGVSVQVDAQEGLTTVGDRTRLEQALGNLVDNALRYGDGTVELQAQPENGFVALRVSDAGAGFPAEFLPHAFERFSRADGARSRGAAGLGLAIVDAIARAHGGSADARNRAGGGAQVTLLLPSRRGQAG
jgi:two-component system, OmpR family, sensor kinase